MARTGRSAPSRWSAANVLRIGCSARGSVAGEAGRAGEAGHAARRHQHVTRERPVAVRGVRPNGVVMAVPTLGDHLGLARVEDLPIETLVRNMAVSETLR